MCNTPPSPLGGKASLQVRVRVGVQHCAIGVSLVLFLFCSLDDDADDDDDDVLCEQVSNDGSAFSDAGSVTFTYE